MRLQKFLLPIVMAVVSPMVPCVALAQQPAKTALAFEAASIRQNERPAQAPGPGPAPGQGPGQGPGQRIARSANVPLDAEDAFAPTGGLYAVKGFPLSSFIAFAYKQPLTTAIQAQLPAWTKTATFDIEARATGNPTKDQYREMVRTLLAERFKLQTHTEMKQTKFYGMVLIKPGQPGPQLRAHPADDHCSGVPTVSPMGTVSARPPEGADLKKPTTIVGQFPPFCGGVVAGLPVDPENMPGFYMAGGRGMSMALIADFFSMRGPSNNLGDRPILDRSGLTGNYDFIVEWSSLNAAITQTVGPAMQDALKEQLGVKLEPGEGPVETLIIDHVEQPTAN